MFLFVIKERSDQGKRRGGNKQIVIITFKKEAL